MTAMKTVFFILLILLKISDSPKLRSGIGFQSHNDHHGNDSFDHCKRNLGRCKNKHKFAQGSTKGSICVVCKSQLERDRQAILEYYRSEGYLLAEVGYRETPVDENKNLVTFIVREGEKVKVRQFDIQGNDNVPAEDIMEHMVTKLDQWWGGGEFKENIDRAGGEGTAVFFSYAICCFCGK